MGEFSVNALTGAGRALIAQATAANRVMYTRMATRSDAMTQAQATGAQLSDFDGPSGAIAAASATGEVARIVGRVQNAGVVELSLRTFALCGRTEGMSSAEPDVVIVVLSDPVPAAILPPAGGVDSAAAIGFSLRISAGESGMISVTPAGSATVADLARFVSLHTAGDSATGEAQTILGQKTFSDKLTAAQDLSVLGDLDVLYNATVLGTVEAMGDVSVSGVATVGGLKGTTPEYDANNTLSVPIGGIIGAYSTSAATAGGGLHVYTSTQLKTAHWDPGTSQYVEGLYYIPAGLYRILAGLKAPGVGEGGLVLLQRLEGEP